MKLTNNEIYEYAIVLSNAFADNTRLPMKINFYLQKNKKTLIELARDIEESRTEIIRNYGEPIGDGAQYTIAKDNIEVAQKELEDLLLLEQDVNICMISADSLTDDVSLTTSQMEAIMFMIE